MKRFNFNTSKWNETCNVVGLNAAKIAVGIGAIVSVMDINQSRLVYLDDLFLRSDHHLDIKQL